jgi:hypothetical protein
MEVLLQHGLKFHQLHNLRSLSLYNICSRDIMLAIMSDLKSLRHLTLADCHLLFDQKTNQTFIDTIWSLPTLIYCYLNVSFKGIRFVLPRAN